jgi:phosphoglycerate dehydrogenase-like enzyme
MINGKLIASMKEGATLINTARGAIIAEEEMIEVLSSRPDLSAILDVTHPEPPAADSPLRTLPNVILTPHIAGSTDAECARMGKWMVDELRRYLEGAPLQYLVKKETLARKA